MSATGTNLMSDFIATAADCIARQRAKADDPATSAKDAHDIQCHIGGAEFILTLAREFYSNAIGAEDGK